jgi:hypothetical protein
VEVLPRGHSQILLLEAATDLFFFIRLFICVYIGPFLPPLSSPSRPLPLPPTPPRFYAESVLPLSLILTDHFYIDEKQPKDFDNIIDK